MEELVVGEWYDMRGCGYPKEVAARYRGTSKENAPNEKEYFYMDAYIRTDDGYKETSSGNWFMPKELKKFPLEELEKWLPKPKEPEYSIF